MWNIDLSVNDYIMWRKSVD